jgi:hypothetical protein
MRGHRWILPRKFLRLLTFLLPLPAFSSPPYSLQRVDTKVAVIRQQQIQSPLDTLTGKTRACPSPQQIGLPRSPSPVA